MEHAAMRAIALFAVSLSITACATRPARGLEVAQPTNAHDGSEALPALGAAAEVGSAREMIPGEVVFLRHQARVRVRGPDTPAVAIVDTAESGRAGTLVVRAMAPGEATFHVELAGAVAHHAVKVFPPSADSLEGELVRIFEKNATARLFRRSEAPAERSQWIVDACFSDAEAELLVELARRYAGRVETVARRVANPRDGCKGP